MVVDEQDEEEDVDKVSQQSGDDSIIPEFIVGMMEGNWVLPVAILYGNDLNF